MTQPLWDETADGRHLRDTHGVSDGDGDDFWDEAAKQPPQMDFNDMADLLYQRWKDDRE